MSLLDMSVSGAVFIIAIVIIRVIGINRLPKKMFLVLWMITLLRLLIPFSISSVFSVYTLIDGNRFTPEISVTDANNMIQDIRVKHPIAIMEGTLQQNTVSVVSPLFIVWCVGMVVLATIFVVSYLRCFREFQTALPVHNSYAEQWLKEHPRKRKILLKQSDQILSPLTYGIFHPVILMPKNTDWEDRKALQFILTHEYVHVYRLDAVTKLMMAAALCVHWFNPFVWAMYFLFNRDLELACDESVLRLLGTQTKSDYARMLINMEAKKSGLSPLCNNFSKNAIEERITAIMKTKKTTIFSFVLACLIVIGATAVFATSARATDHLSSEAQISAADVEWWTYDEYKEWLENERVRLQGNVGETSVNASDFAAYAKYGLRWDDDEKVLYYNGKRVRYFFDGVDLGVGNGQAVALEYSDPNCEGETDVYTVRQRIDHGDGSYDPLGLLTGLAEYSQKEFDERVLLPASLPAEAGDTIALGYTTDELATVTDDTDDTIDETDVAYETAVAEGTDGGTTFAEIFAKYRSYGITYVEADGERNVYYNGRLVHNFADITPDGGVFSFTSSKDGGINLKTRYADGKLCGVTQMER